VLPSSFIDAWDLHHPKTAMAELCMFAWYIHPAVRRWLISAHELLPFPAAGIRLRRRRMLRWISEKENLAHRPRVRKTCRRTDGWTDIRSTGKDKAQRVWQTLCNACPDTDQINFLSLPCPLQLSRSFFGGLLMLPPMPSITRRSRDHRWRQMLGGI